MARQFHVPQIDGLEALAALLHDTKRYEAYMQALKELRDEVTKRIEMLSKVEEADGMLALADIKDRNAKALLEQAKIDAAALVMRAQKEAKSIITQAAAQASEAREQLDVVNTRVKALANEEARLILVEEACRKRESDAQQAMSKAIALRDKAEAELEDYGTRKRRLLEIVV